MASAAAVLVTPDGSALTAGTTRGGLGQAGVEIVVPAVSMVGGSLAPHLATWLGLSVPVVGAAIAGVAIALTAIFSRRGPKQKEAATAAANEVEQLLQRNVEAYLAGPRTAQNQAAALQNFDAAWAWLTSSEGCGSPQLGDPGRRCIAERQRGGSAPWCPTVTGCDWFINYRDSIANDPTVGVQASAQSGTQTADGLFDWGGGGAGAGAPASPSPGLVLAGLALVAVGVALS